MNQRFFASQKKEILPPSYEGLFQFITKNTELPRAIEKAGMDETKNSLLLEAIDKCDFSSPAMLQKDAYLHLFYLIKTEQLDFWQGMNIYMYMLAISEYTHHGPIRGIEYNNCKDMTVTMKPLLNENTDLTDDGKDYLITLNNFLSQQKIASIQKNQFIQLLKSLPRSDTFIMCMSFALNEYSPNVVDLLRFMHKLSRENNQILNQFGSIVASENPVNAESILSSTLPALGLIQKIAAFLPGFTSPLPCFGRVSSATLLHMHSQQLHPLSLFCPLVSSNLTVAHEIIMDKTALFIHDLEHCNWMSYFSDTAIRKIYRGIIPALSRLAEIAPEPINQHIKNIILAINDFDLSEIHLNMNTDILKEYMDKISNIRPPCIQEAYFTIPELIKFHRAYLYEKNTLMESGISLPWIPCYNISHENDSLNSVQKNMILQLIENGIQQGLIDEIILDKINISIKSSETPFKQNPKV